MSVTAVPLRPLARGSVLKLWIGLALLTLAAVALAWVGTSAQQAERTASGLRYRVIEEGTGPTITPADLVVLHYTGRLKNGTVFDSSEARGGEPMVTGVTGIIPGFTEGLQLMREGGRYRLWIPPQLGYGGQVPPGAPFTGEDTLIFDIHIVEVAEGMAAMQQLMGPRGPGGARGSGPEGAAPQEIAPDGAPAEERQPPEGNAQSR